MSGLGALFVCRGSVADGLGHVMRTRAVADASPDALEAELVVIGSEHAERVLEGTAAEVSVVAGEAEAVAIAERSSAQIVVFDLTEISAEAFEAITAGRVSASLSPIFPFLDRVDLAFSRTRYTGTGPQPAAEGRYYGLDYAVVRPECRRIDSAAYARGLEEESISIAISLGGADAPNRTLEVLGELRSLDAPATFWVLLGEGYSHSYNELVESVRRDRRHEIILAKTNRSMWRVLGNCSLAILAGGVTTYEAAFAGLPSINVLATSGDDFLIRELVEAGAAFDAGVLGAATDSLVETSLSLAANHERLLASHRASQGLLDGGGAGRIVDRMLERVSAGSVEAAGRA